MCRGRTFDAREVLEELVLFGGELRRSRQVLQRTAAADAEMGAARFDAVRRRGQDPDELRLIELTAAAQYPQPYPLAGQRTGDEDDLAVDAGDAAAVVRERDDVRVELGQRRYGAGHAADAGRFILRPASGPSCHAPPGRAHRTPPAR
jgi:hypothetical protein